MFSCIYALSTYGCYVVDKNGLVKYFNKLSLENAGRTVQILSERRGRAEPAISEREDERAEGYCRIHEWLTGGKLFVYLRYPILLA